MAKIKKISGKIKDVKEKTEKYIESVLIPGLSVSDEIIIINCCKNCIRYMYHNNVNRYTLFVCGVTIDMILNVSEVETKKSIYDKLTVCMSIDFSETEVYNRLTGELIDTFPACVSSDDIRHKYNSDMVFYRYNYIHDNNHVSNKDINRFYI